MFFKKIYFIAILLASTSLAMAQAPKTTFTLEEVLEMARDYSPSAILAKHQFRAAYWEHRTYKAEYLPSVTLNGTLPNLNRSLVRYQLEDGTYRYIEENSNTASVGLSVNQNIGLTGGRIFASSNLERTDFFGDNKGTNYMSVPMQIGFSQPIFGFNELKWKKKIEPLKYLEAKRNYIQSMEEIAGESIRYFFDLVLAQQNLQTAQINYANTDTLYQIAKGRERVATNGTKLPKCRKLGKRGRNWFAAKKNQA